MKIEVNKFFLIYSICINFSKHHFLFCNGAYFLTCSCTLKSVSDESDLVCALMRNGMASMWQEVSAVPVLPKSCS